MPIYQPGIPTGTVKLSSDYLNLQNNFNQLNVAYGVDHVQFSDTTGAPPGGRSGLHTAVHLNDVSTTATNPPNNYPPVFPAAYHLTCCVFATQSNDVLWMMRGAGDTIQLSRNFTPSLLTNNYAAADGSGNVGTMYSAGYTFLPGALSYQYGSVNFGSGGIPSTPLTVKLPLKFINASSVIVSLTAISKASGATINETIGLVSGSVTTTQFQWNAQTSTSQYVGITWTAVGN